MNKKLLVICVLIQMTFVACNSIYNLTPKILYVKDSKPCTDSLYEVWGHYYNAREIELQFVVKNRTGEDLYLPLSTHLFPKDDSISVCLSNGQECITPVYYIKKVPYDSDIIRANESMRIIIKILSFPEWQRDWCNVSMDIEEIISKLKITYKSNKDYPDKTLKKANLIFDEKITDYTIYEIPSGRSIDIM